MPRLWDETIEAHRRVVGEAILDSAAELASTHGVRSVTMSQIAQEAGIARATLYKYFSDVDAILVAWHERQVGAHLEHLLAARERGDTAIERLNAVLQAYALIAREHHGGELAALLHQGEHVARAQQHVSNLIADLLTAAACEGAVRDDVSPLELTNYCLHALSGASQLPSRAATSRLVAVTLAGLRGPSEGPAPGGAGPH